MNSTSAKSFLKLLTKFCWSLLLLAISLYLANQEWNIINSTQLNLTTQDPGLNLNSTQELVMLPQLSLTRIMSVIIGGLSLAGSSLLIYEKKNLA